MIIYYYQSRKGSSLVFTAGLLVSESGYLEKCLVSSIPLLKNQKRNSDYFKGGV